VAFHKDQVLQIACDLAANCLRAAESLSESPLQRHVLNDNLVFADFLSFSIFL